MWRLGEALVAAGEHEEAQGVGQKAFQRLEEYLRPFPPVLYEGSGTVYRQNQSLGVSTVLVGAPPSLGYFFLGLRLVPEKA